MNIHDKTVYKYPIKITDVQTISIRKIDGSDHKIVFVGLDPSGVPCVWIEHTKQSNIIENIELYIHGTGHTISGDETHIGSFKQDCFIWHLYI